MYGMLGAGREAFNGGGSREEANRQATASRLSITQSLPIRRETQIRQVDGVRDVAYGMWFGGIYQDPTNFFPNFSVSPNYFDVYRELQLDPAQLEGWKHTRTAAIPRERPADTLAWQIGGTIARVSVVWGGNVDLG